VPADLSSSIPWGLAALSYADPLRPAETPYLLAYLATLTDLRIRAGRRHSLGRHPGARRCRGHLYGELPGWVDPAGQAGATCGAAEVVVRASIRRRKPSRRAVSSVPAVRRHAVGRALVGAGGAQRRR
jgi:hypothetical protein